MLVLETIDLNGIQSLYSISINLKLNEVIPNKVAIWKLRNNNPMRKSYIKNSIKKEEFEALTSIVVEMSKYLYPYMRSILQSRDQLDKDPSVWNDFKNRFIELIKERLNINSIRVIKLLDSNFNDEILIKNLLILSLCISDNGYQKLITYLLNY